VPTLGGHDNGLIVEVALQALGAGEVGAPRGVEKRGELTSDEAVRGQPAALELALDLGAAMGELAA
jgi:hypothetical protein